MTDTNQQPWQPYDPDMTVDQKASYDALRDKQPFAKHERFGWTAMRYRDVVEIMKQPDKFSNAAAWAAVDPGLKPDQRAIPLALDPPEHTDYRIMLRELFIPKRIEGYQQQARDKASTLLQIMIDKGRADVVEGFTDPYPVQSLCTFLGWRDAYWADIKRWSRELTAARSAQQWEEADRLFAMWHDYIDSVLQARKQMPEDDVASWLIEMSDNGNKLNDEQMISIMRLLLVAGHGTTTTALGNMIEYLASHPDKQRQLREHPELLPSAIEEMLRYNSPQMAMPRRTTCPVSVNNQSFDQDESIWLNFLAANRDPDQFENPTECDFTRRPNRHIAFGSGIHTCLGSTFGRMEIRVALEEMFARTKSFYLDPEHQTTYNTWPHNQPKCMMVIFEKADQ